MFPILTQFYIQSVHMSSHMSPALQFFTFVLLGRHLEDRRQQGRRLSVFLTAYQNQEEVEMKTFVSDSCTSSLPPPFHTFTCLLSWIPSPSHSLLVNCWFSPWHVIITTSTFISLTFKTQSSLLFKACVFNFKNKLKSTKLYSVFLLLHLPTPGSHFIGAWCDFLMFILLAITFW